MWTEWKIIEIDYVSLMFYLIFLFSHREMYIIYLFNLRRLSLTRSKTINSASTDRLFAKISALNLPIDFSGTLPLNEYTKVSLVSRSGLIAIFSYVFLERALTDA
ncbi:hypothetical protein BpHYR1_032658 [Brachionus plicatilis]|uniref:Uncharacterized protein n=1 Tax=Brachionus plicatilis TaxID=10195 RepID=A0A3M7R0Q6_BRAPC|nr:hypothetical protein BpHYR1_032658 [Brachionus plicatilis]